MTDHLHNLEQGQRVNYLANLGGLVALAKLDHLTPDLLLGAFLEVGKRLSHLPESRLTELKALGRDKLVSRNAEKRSFKSWQRAHQTERFDLSKVQMQRLIVKLGGKTPAFEKDIPSELRRLFSEIIRG